MAKLLVAFPAGNQATSAEEGALRMEVYAEAIDGFPPVVVMRVLRHLLLHNPRSPFAPVPQDVYEECNRGYGAWRAAVVHYAGDGGWRTPSVYNSKHSYLFDPCPPPWAEGHPLAPKVIKAILLSNNRWQENLTCEWSLPPDEVFNRIPHDCFKPGERERVLENRKGSKERAARRALAEE
jgi:hypothetical protein